MKVILTPEAFVGLRPPVFLLVVLGWGGGVLVGTGNMMWRFIEEFGELSGDEEETLVMVVVPPNQGFASPMFRNDGGLRPKINKEKLLELHVQYLH